MGASLAAPAAVPRARRGPRLGGLVLLGLAGVLLAEAPLALAWCCGPRDLAGLGTFWFINDFAQYEAAMDQGAASPGWLVYDRFTPEPHQPALMFPLYVGLGKLAGLLGAPVEPLYRLLELGARVALVWSLAAFCAWLLGRRRDATLAMLFSLFGMGLGFPLAVVGAALGLTDVYTGNGSYEVNTFGLLFSAPHASLAMAVTLAVPPAFVAYLEAPRPGPLLGLALGGLALALLHPFHLPVLLAALALEGVLQMRDGCAPRVVALAATLPALVAVPLLAYTAATFNLDPFWGATYGAQNVLPSPRPWELPVDYGVVLLLAGVGAAGWRGAALSVRSRRLLLLWCGLTLLAMYLPLPYQRRFSFGLQPALAVLAAAGLLRVRSWLVAARRPRLARWIEPAALTLALATSATALAGIAASALLDAPIRPYRATAQEAAAAAWLARVVRSDQVVLADWDTSNYLAGRLPGRVLGGHPVATLDARRRRAELAWFFVADEAARRRFVDAAGVAYVFYGRRERGLGRLEPRPWLEPVFERPGVAVFAVRGGEE